MKKDLTHYMRLPYTIEIVPIPEDQGGGFTATLPEIGRLAIVADGDSLKEALSNLEEVKKERFAEYLERGLEIPEPELEQAPVAKHGKKLKKKAGQSARWRCGCIRRKEVRMKR